MILPKTDREWAMMVAGANYLLLFEVLWQCFKPGLTWSGWIFCWAIVAYLCFNLRELRRIAD